MIKKILMALLDGFISALLIFLIAKYCISIFVSFESLFFEIFLVLISVFISAISAMYNLKYNNVREMLTGYLISFFSTILFLCIIFWLYTISVKFEMYDLLPTRTLGNADGLYVMFVEGIYLVGVFWVRSIIFLIQLAKMLKKRRLEKITE